MARDHSDKPEQEEGPVYVEREVTLSLVNQKLNEVLKLTYLLCEKAGVSVEQ